MADAERSKIVQAARKYGEKFKAALPADKAPVSGKVFDGEELAGAVEAVLDGWWTEAEYSAQFEQGLEKFVGTKHCLTVNSGSSANLVAFYSLTSRKLGGRRIRKGDEVVSVAAAFPTTVNPIIQYGCVPVFVDVELGTYNASLDAVEDAITDKTKAIFLAHTLGNPFEADKIRKLADEHGLWLVEDACDALGSKLRGKMAGTFGHVSTLSFYPAHQITTAEGGAVLSSDPLLDKIARSVRDWGRDCWCPTGKDDSCKKRFGWKLGNLPQGYDHKYTYSEIGYNLKMTDIQAAIGTAQLKKLPGFVEKRRENFGYLKKRFAEEGLDARFLLPKEAPGSEPSWFGFPLTITDGTDRTNLLKFLDSHGVGNRLLFAGNITKQPYFVDNKPDCRVHGSLSNTDTIMEKTFWIGVYPALEKQNLDYAVSKFKQFFQA